jgi:ubiquinone/menaquinone biosynthesis C-methylase UbiE
MNMKEKQTSNTEIFSGKAETYAAARPGYPEEAIDYIISLVPHDSVYADIGAGTGKFTECLARRGVRLSAVEPNADMRVQLEATLMPYTNAKIFSGTAEQTTLPDNSVDVIIIAQALHWFDFDKFRTECRRIGKRGAIVIAVYNNTPGGSSIAYSKNSTDEFFNNPTVAEFPNPIYYTRESWINYRLSHSDDPLPTDSNYFTHIKEVNMQFDNENVDGMLKREVVTAVYHEVL